MSAPVDNLVRAWAGPQAIEFRANAAEGNKLVGHFAVFDTWTEINSYYEGQFLERIGSGAFDQTFKERGDKIRVLYDHGADPSIGNKPLGTPDVLREDNEGAYYEVDLFDASYVNDLKPALRAGQLGASFRFRVTSEDWDNSPKSSDYNPAGLPERTITGAEVYEFGPVTFPAYPEASAGMRSRTDEFLERFLDDPKFVARFRERVGPAVVNQIRATLPPTADEATAEETPTATAATEARETPTAIAADPESGADGTERDATDQTARRIALHKGSTTEFDAFLARRQ